MGFIENIQQTVNEKTGITLNKSQIVLTIFLCVMVVGFFIVLLMMDTAKPDPAGTQLAPPSKIVPIYEGK